MTNSSFIQCKGINKRTGKRCTIPVMNTPFDSPSQYCSRHIENEPDSLYCRCGVKYLSQGRESVICKEIVLKRFGVCHKHFNLFLDSCSSSEVDPALWETLNFLNTQISTLRSEMENCSSSDRRLYHQKYKNLKKYQSMRLQTVQRVRSSTGLSPQEESFPKGKLTKQEFDNEEDFFVKEKIFEEITTPTVKEEKSDPDFTTSTTTNVGSFPHTFSDINTNPENQIYTLQNNNFDQYPAIPPSTEPLQQSQNLRGVNYDEVSPQSSTPTFSSNPEEKSEISQESEVEKKKNESPGSGALRSIEENWEAQTSIPIHSYGISNYGRGNPVFLSQNGGYGGYGSYGGYSVNYGGMHNGCMERSGYLIQNPQNRFIPNMGSYGYSGVYTPSFTNMHYFSSAMTLPQFTQQSYGTSYPFPVQPKDLPDKHISNPSKKHPDIPLNLKLFQASSQQPNYSSWGNLRTAPGYPLYHPYQPITPQHCFQQHQGQFVGNQFYSQVQNISSNKNQFQQENFHQTHDLSHHNQPQPQPQSQLHYHQPQRQIYFHRPESLTQSNATIHIPMATNHLQSQNEQMQPNFQEMNQIEPYQQLQTQSSQPQYFQTQSSQSQPSQQSSQQQSSQSQPSQSQPSQSQPSQSFQTQSQIEVDRLSLQKDNQQQVDFSRNEVQDPLLMMYLQDCINYSESCIASRQPLDECLELSSVDIERGVLSPSD